MTHTHSTIDIKRMLRDARNKYGRYTARDYGRGAARQLALDDQLREIQAKKYPHVSSPDLAEFTGCEWEESDRPEDFDGRIHIGGGWYQYTNNGYNSVLRSRRQIKK